MNNLFGDVFLGEQDDFIDIPGKEEKLADKEETEDKTVTTTTTPPKDDDGFIEVKVGKNKDTFFDNKSDEEDEDLDSEESDTDKDDKTPPKESKGSSSSSPFKPFAKALSEEGFLSSFEDEEFDKLVEELGSESEVLMELSRRAIIQEIDEYKNSAETDFKEFLQARDSGIDLNEWASVYEAKKTYTSIDEEKIEADEDLQKSLVAQNLRYRGMPEDEIEDAIEAYETTGKLVDNAKKAHKNLIKAVEQQETKLKEDKVKQEEKLKKDREETLKTLKKEVDAIVEIVPGIKINKQTKDKLYNNITSPIKEGPNGEPMNLAMVKRAENPLKYAIIENYLIEMGVFDGNWDKISTRQKTKAISELEKVLSDSKNTNFIPGKSTLGKGGSDDDIEFSLGNFK